MTTTKQTILTIALTVLCAYGMLALAASMTVSAAQVESVYTSIHGGK